MRQTVDIIEFRIYNIIYADELWSLLQLVNSRMENKMDEQNKIEEVKTEAVTPEVEENAQIRKMREKKEREEAKAAEKAAKQAEKEVLLREKLVRDMEKHNARQKKYDEWKSVRDAKRIERDKLDKAKADAKRIAKRKYYTEDELTPLLANRNSTLAQAWKNAKQAEEEVAK